MLPVQRRHSSPHLGLFDDIHNLTEYFGIELTYYFVKPNHILVDPVRSNVVAGKIAGATKAVKSVRKYV